GRGAASGSGPVRDVSAHDLRPARATAPAFAYVAPARRDAVENANDVLAPDQPMRPGAKALHCQAESAPSLPFPLRGGVGGGGHLRWLASLSPTLPSREARVVASVKTTRPLAHEIVFGIALQIE